MSQSNATKYTWKSKPIIKCNNTCTCNNINNSNDNISNNNINDVYPYFSIRYTCT